MTPLTPPRDDAVSPCLRGIRWTWQWNTVWPLTSPTLVPILSSSTRCLKQQLAVFTRVRVGRYWVKGTADQMGAVYFAECSIQFIE